VVPGVPNSVLVSIFTSLLSSTIAQPTFARNEFSMMNYELKQLPSKTVSEVPIAGGFPGDL
jgi:hypothetical protein